MGYTIKRLGQHDEVTVFLCSKDLDERHDIEWRIELPSNLLSNFLLQCKRLLGVCVIFIFESFIKYSYRPQGKVMFSHVSVILSTIGLMATWSLLVPQRGRYAFLLFLLSSYPFFLSYIWDVNLPYHFIRTTRSGVNRSLFFCSLTFCTGFVS